MVEAAAAAGLEWIIYLVERLPVMITPRWVRSLNQPIAIRNLITYLTGCLEAIRLALDRLEQENREKMNHL